MSLRSVALALAMAGLWAGSAAAGAGEPRARLNDHGGLLVDGKPFLPLIVWAQPSSTLAEQKQLGLNTVHVGESEAKDPLQPYLDQAQKLGLMVLVDRNRYQEAVKGHPAILAWTVEHEPEMAEPAPYEVDQSSLNGGIWIEAESADRSTFKPDPWLGKPSAQLSGGKWLSSNNTGAGSATYPLEVKQGGSYHLWVREFNKSWANPTRWQLDDQPAHETSRSAKAVKRVGLGGGRDVGWVDYGVLTLTPGAHTLTLSIVPGRTLGDAKRAPDPKAVWAVDALCLTNSSKPPAAASSGFVPRRPPSVEKENYEFIRHNDPTALTWAVLTAGFHKSYNRLPMDLYRQYLQYTDIVSFDHYPVTGWNRPDRVPEVGVATRQLVEMARPNQPVWTFVEASDQQLAWTPPQTHGPTPQEMRAEAWMSIAGGAKGVGYFTIGFGRGKNFQWNNLTGEIKAEMKRTNAQLTELAAPIVLGDTSKKLTVSGDDTKDPAANGHAIMAIRKELEGKTYVIAVNMTRQPARATFHLADAPAAAQVQVWKESRALPLAAGSFTDTLPPLAARVYTAH
jgi:hypothetical protein